MLREAGPSGPVFWRGCPAGRTYSEVQVLTPGTELC